MKRALPFLFVALLPAFAVPAQAPLKGRIADSTTGEPLSGVEVDVECPGLQPLKTFTSSEGAFEIQTPGSSCRLMARLVGYRPLRTTTADAGPELRLALTPDQATRRDAVEVTAGPFEIREQSSPSERTLSAAEVKNLAGLIGDDPMRAVQAMPGVAANNDYGSQFTLRGSGFERVGILYDGILLHSPFHSVQTQVSEGSLTMFNADVVQEVTLHAGAPPVRYPDRATGFVDVGLREGNRRGTMLRLQAGVAATSLVADGPLNNGKGSWLAAARKSYLQYLLRRAQADATLAFGFVDLQGRINYDLTPRHSLSLSILDGYSDLDREFARQTLSVNTIMLGGYHTTLGTASWRYTPSSSATITNRSAWIRESFNNQNRDRLDMGEGQYGEWVWNSDANWTWARQAPLAAGFQLRRLRDDGVLNRYNASPVTIRRRETWRGNALRTGAFLEQGYSTPNGLLTLTAGARFDQHEMVSGAAVSPHASAMLRLTSSTRLQAAWSQATQFPEISMLTLSLIGNRGLRPPRSTHLVAALEQRLGDRTRLRLETYERRDRELIWQPLMDPRLSPSGQILPAAVDPRFENSLRGRSRGFEIFLQRRAANRFTGWVSYSYNWTRMDDSVLRHSFPSDWDQRHAINTYWSYRIRPTVSLSTRYTYGSNFPVPGFLRRSDSNTYFLASARNQVRLGAYHRADMRLNKSFQWKSWRGTLFVEVMNLTSRENFRYDTLGGYNNRTGQAFPRFDKLFPIVPAAGVMFEWDALGWRR